jgi:glycerol-3-phosphate dehydrogenase
MEDKGSINKRLRRKSFENLANNKFDIIVIGGGATGAGVALDAAQRGLKVALLECGDFSSGTSSRSTKLVHGGVRYLEQAVKGFDRKQFTLVTSALRERENLIKLAPHLVYKISLVTPLYSWLKIPYVLLGLKMYDWIAGKAGLGNSRYLSAKSVVERCPNINTRGLKGAVLFWDGQFDDARMNIELILSAKDEGAEVVNYCNVVELVKEEGKTVGVKAKDILSGYSLIIKGSVVVNATGPFVDAVRRLDDPTAMPILQVSSGAHIVVSGVKWNSGVLIPETKDGRVVFMLPWKGHLLVGTTDEKAAVTFDPKATEEEIDYLLFYANKYLLKPLTRSDIRSAWSGLRPLVQGGTEFGSTAKLLRDHYLAISSSGVITITGGKWTTYRLMAHEVVDSAVKLGEFSTVALCCSDSLPLRGNKGLQALSAKSLSSEYCEVSEEVAQHLISTYGSRSKNVLEIARAEKSYALILDGWPYIEAEVAYCVRYEMVVTADDYLSRRTRLRFCNQDAAARVVKKVEKLIEFS